MTCAQALQCKDQHPLAPRQAAFPSVPVQRILAVADNQRQFRHRAPRRFDDAGKGVIDRRHQRHRVARGGKGIDRQRRAVDETVDGQDVVEVYAAAKQAADRARTGDGPTLIEANTYRYYGHFKGDPVNYRPEGEADEYHRRDPLKVFSEQIAESAGITPSDLEAVNAQVENRMAEALEHARSSPLPAPEECLVDAYVSY